MEILTIIEDKYADKVLDMIMDGATEEEALSVIEDMKKYEAALKEADTLTIRCRNCQYVSRSSGYCNLYNQGIEKDLQTGFVYACNKCKARMILRQGA